MCFIEDDEPETVEEAAAEKPDQCFRLLLRTYEDCRFLVGQPHIAWSPIGTAVEPGDSKCSRASSLSENARELRLDLRRRTSGTM